MRNILPILIFCILASISVALWQNQNNHHRDRALRHTETSAEQIRLRVEGLMYARMASLELLAARWVERMPPDFSKTRFLQFAEAFYTYFPGFTAIIWIDPDGLTRWIYPLIDKARATGKNAHEHLNTPIPKALLPGQRDGGLGVTPCIELQGGRFGFHAFLPLIYSDRIQGYLEGAFELDHILEISLAKDILDDFRVRIYEGERLVYVNRKPDGIPSGEDRFHVQRTIRFPGKTWKLALEPTASVYAPTLFQNLPFLVFGLAISGALSLLLYFLIQRLRMYRQARDHALFEVSERKRAQDTLRENEKKLEALVTEIAAKNAELETFVYSVSHDLKTPIVTIEGFVGALREDFGGALTEDGERYLQYMSDATRKMELLINDLLELSRVGRLTETPTDVPLKDIVEEVLETLDPKIRARGIRVNLQPDLPLVYGEKKRLLQVMENLVSNAVKYLGKVNPSPRIDIGFEKENGQKIIFVRDNGIGIPERYFEKIFQVFQRLPEAKRIEEGTGVGLTTVKRIIEHHGGKIWLTSEPGKGTTFFFILKEKEA